MCVIISYLKLHNQEVQLECRNDWLGFWTAGGGKHRPIQHPNLPGQDSAQSHKLVALVASRSRTLAHLQEFRRRSELVASGIRVYKPDTYHHSIITTAW